MAYILSDENVIEKEFGAYKGDDVISTDIFDMSQNGIIHKNIIDWLLEE